MSIQTILFNHGICNIFISLKLKRVLAICKFLDFKLTKLALKILSGERIYIFKRVDGIVSSFIMTSFNKLSIYTQNHR